MDDRKILNEMNITIEYDKNIRIKPVYIYSIRNFYHSMT